MARSSRWAAAMLLLGCATAAASDKPPEPRNRRALVIGNGAYEKTPLPVCSKDAAAVAASLRGMGFVVSERTNRNSREMKRDIREYARTLREGDLSFVYYSGQAAIAGQHLYLLPVDVDASTPDGLGAAHTLDALFDALETDGLFASVIVLDGSYDNRSAREIAAKGWPVINAPAETILACTTSFGEPALPEELHSADTARLLEWLDKPGLDVELIFRRVGLMHVITSDRKVCLAGPCPPTESPRP